MTTRHTILVPALAGIFLAAFGATANGHAAAALGAGADGCTLWRQDRAQQRPSSEGRAEMGWIMGYLAAANTLYWPDGALADGMSVKDVGAWVDDFCVRYPSENMAGASEALVTDMAHLALERQTQRLSQGEIPRGEAPDSAPAAKASNLHGHYSAMPNP